MTYFDRHLIVGVDPGATTGFCALPFRGRDLDGPPLIAQCNPHAVTPMLAALVDGSASVKWAVERFVDSARATRSQRSDPAKITRGVIREVELKAHFDRRGSMQLRNASVVKQWADNDRLKRAGLLTSTAGMDHARDAARHALYAAVFDGRMADPLTGTVVVAS